MPRLTVELNSEQRVGVTPGEFRVVAVFTNKSDEVASLNTSQASHPSLVLQVQDAQGERVLLGPPDAPTEKDGGPGEPVEPEGTGTIEYVGFLDRSLAPGRYQVRYFGQYEPLGGSRQDPLVSEWLDFEVAAPEVPWEIVEPLPPRRVDRAETGLQAFLSWFWNWWHNILCFLRRIFGGERCDGVFTRDVDEARTEVMSDAPPGFEAWNGTYGWRARFRTVVDQRACRVTVTIKVRLVGAITDAQKTAWENAIEADWSNVFKLDRKSVV